MNIPTANIVVAFSKEVMDRLFQAGATYKSLVADLADGDTDALLFNNVANPNFVSFEHTTGIDKMAMKLVLIDPNEEFERKFFTNNPARLIQGFSNPEAEKSEGFLTDKPDDVKKSQSKYEKEYVAQFKQELRKHIGERDIYVAYGTGNNLELWSGPHRTVLTNADISIKGARKISLTLTPTSNAFDIGNRRGAYNEKVNLNLKGLKIRTEGVSQPAYLTEDKVYNPPYFSSDTKYTRAGAKLQLEDYQTEEGELLSSGGFEELSKKIEKFDIHAMVVDALRSYVQKATNNKNVIVLLPNLNVVCRQAINDEAKKYDLVRKQINEEINTAQAQAFSFQENTSLFADISDEINTKYATSATEIGREKLFLEGTLKKFGLRLHEVPNLGIGIVKAFANGSLQHLISTEDTPTYESAARKHFSEKIFYAVVDKTDREMPDHMGVLENIYNKILKLSAESYGMSTMAVMTETETKVLSLWGKHKWRHYPTFAGYDAFTENSSAVIVGDLALIKSYLYGDVDIEGKNQAINKFKEGATKQALKNVKNAATVGLGLFGLADSSDALEDLKTDPTIESYNIAAALQHPIHPADKILLLDSNYNRDISKIMNPSIENTVGSFGDIGYLPDEFGFKETEFTEEQKTFIREKNIPVFRYNTQNPNVLDLKFKFGAIYFALLKAGYQKEISRLTSAVAEGVLPTGIGSFPIRERGAAIAYLRSKGFSQGMGDKDKQEAINQLAAKISPTLVESLETDSAEAGADSFAAILEEKEDSDLKSLILVDQELPGNPNSILANMSEDLYRKAMQMSITTLPTFHLSRLGTINTQCLVFAQDQPITQTSRLKRTAMNKFFSGLYKIMGFKHTITTSAATSEFKLVKNAPNFNEKEDNKKEGEIDG